MIAVLFALLMVSPTMAVESPQTACHWWSRYDGCRDMDVEYIGELDARPSPEDWSPNNFPTAPPDWGAYPAERAVPASFP